MKIRIVFSVALLMTGFTLFSQTQVGLKYDINGQAFNGYFNLFTYSPEKKITVVHNSDSYEVGYYYDSPGKKIHGLIKFENDKILFKYKSRDIDRVKLKPDEINYFVLGVDSFFAIANFYFKSKIKTEPEFVQYITAFNGLTFAKHYHFTSGFAQNYGGQVPIIETFLVKKRDSSVWENFPDNKRFEECALKYFGHIPYLKDKITSGDYDSDNMMSIIKMAEYYEKHKNSELIYYDKNWQEIQNSEDAEYSARISNKIDSIWTFEYYKDSIRLYTADYSSFYPHTKNGRFISYFPDGRIRQIIKYKNNKPKDVKLFEESGNIKLHYQPGEEKNPKTWEMELFVKYLQVMDSTGNNLIESDNTFSLEVYDDFADIYYTHVYKDSELISSYRLIDNDTVYQITNPNYNFKIKGLQKKLDYYMTDKEYNEALSVNAQGMILISLIIDKKGKATDCTVLNTIHSELDILVENYIKSRLLPGADYLEKFTPYKIDKVKQFCEIVIPIEFSINRFYRRPPSYNYNHMYWHMHQQHMMNSFQPPPPPPMPRGF